MNLPSEKYNIIKELIGKGSTALVYKIIDLINNKIYAVKESLSKEAEFLFKNEINIFNKFQNLNPYIIHFYNYKILPHKISLELEYCQYGSLRDLLKKAKKKQINLTENEISSIIYMVLNGLNFMHEKNLINRDVKCKNILVNKEGLAKLCDFGISQTYQKDLYPKNKAGSPYWMAPELINMQKYNKSIDIWSLGITCIELAEYEPPYINYDKSEALEKIKKNPPKGLSFPNKWSHEFNHFVRSCLNVNKYKRPNCQELLEHDFIKNIDKKKLNRKLIILQMLSKLGCKVIYNKKGPVFKINKDSNIFSKTFYNTKNNFFSRTNKNFFDKNKLRKEFEEENQQNNYTINSNMKKFNLHSKILQKKIINLKYDNFKKLNDLDNSEQIRRKSPLINKYMNNNFNNRLSNHTINISLLNESINFIKDKNQENSIEPKNFFMGRVKRNLQRRNDQNFGYNKSFNISEYNYKINEENNINENYIYPQGKKEIKELYYNPKVIKIQKLNKALNTQGNKYINNNIINSENKYPIEYDLNKKRNISLLQTDNNFNSIKNKGDYTISITLSK